MPKYYEKFLSKLQKYINLKNSYKTCFVTLLT